jgi:putative tryptophan/tyrosine transport system substrate-binding protein
VTGRPNGLLIALAVGILFAAPLAAEGQPAGKVARPPRVGVLMLPSEVVARTRVEAFRQGLHDIGYVDGNTIVIDIRYIDGRYERIPALLAELLRLDVSVIVAHGTPPSLAAKRATDSIPIVMFEISDPVGIGLVPSLAKPGGNLTGVAQLVATEIYQKQLQMLQEVVPKLSHVAILWNPANPAQAPIVQQTEIGAKALGISILPLGVQDPGELEKTIVAAGRARAGALVVSRDALFSNHTERIVELTAAHRLPTMYGFRPPVEAGGLIGYGPDPVEIARRAAALVGKILKGAKPADLPVEQPRKFDLVINLKTAKALSLTIPPSLLARADQVIE